MKRFTFIFISIIMFSCASENAPTPVPTSTPTPVPTSTPVIEKVTVNIIDFGFWNSNTTININSIVVWTNNDSSTHTATSLDSKFDSGYISSSGEYSYKFTESGIYNYKCSLHSNMKGKIRVLPENGILIDPTPTTPMPSQSSPPSSSYY